MIANIATTIIILTKFISSESMFGADATSVGFEVGGFVALGLGEAEGVWGGLIVGSAWGLGAFKKGVKFTVPRSKSVLKS